MDNIKTIIEQQNAFFLSGKTKDISYRINQLKLLKNAIKSNEQEILLAMKKDLNKAFFEGYVSEIGMVLDEINSAIKNLPIWARAKKVKTPILHFLSSSKQYMEPYGVALIISPWNYPFQLTMAPLIGAISAGNCAVVKPSAYSSNTSDIIERIIKQIYDEKYVCVIKGGRKENQELLNEKFDYIFFTGSVAVGKIVMEAASKYLTPVSLELGGKSPCIVDETANVDLSAKRIVWGKFLNAGQTCVAPDYLLVHKNIKKDLIEKMKKYIQEFYGTSPHNNPEYPKIINEKHFNRLNNLILNSEVIFGGKSNVETCQISPTLLDNVNWDSLIMQEEIFGPLLPVLEYDDLNHIIIEINNHPKPLALYYFTQNNKNKEYIINNISYGGGCINDTIVHLANPNMPFGGVGESGIGGYHGKASFDTFSHKKSVLEKSNLIDIPLRYPPYKNKFNLIKLIMK